VSRAVEPTQPDPATPAADLTDMVRLTDPQAIRALAHPARLAVLDALNDVDKTMTATQAAQLTGLSPSAMSYHLRALAKWGIVKPADSGDSADYAGAEHKDGRERRWRRGGTGLLMESVAPGTESAAAMIAARSFDLTRDKTLRFLQRSPRESQFWRDNATISHSETWMTEAEVAELNRTIFEIAERLRLDRRTSRRHPDGARLVQASFVVIPVDEPTPPAPGQPPRSTPRGAAKPAR
jgi:DNA-binding transcriptional ArsR family regulator